MKKNRDIYHQTLAVIPVCLCEFSLGVAFGWLSSNIRMFLEDPTSELKPTAEECSWIASLPRFGRTIGPLFSIILLDILGRKMMIQIAAVTFSFLWLTILCTRSVLTLYGAFFVFGLGMGICNGVTSIYLGENCSPKLRGIFCSICVAGFHSAVLVQFSITRLLSYNMIAIVNLVVVFCCLISCILLAVESSQFLMLKNKFDQAEKNMMWLRGTDSKKDIAIDFENIKSNITSEKLKKTSYKELFFARANFKSLAIVLTLNMAHSLTGSTALFTYISILFPANEYFTSTQATVYFGISQLSFCLVASFVIEKFNRRTLALMAFAVFLLCHTTAAFLLYDANYNSSPVPFGTWITFVVVCIFSGCSAVLDSVMHTVRGEIFPQSIKPIGAGLSISANSSMQFVTIKIFLMIKAHYGVHMNFLGYAVISLASFWFCYFALPETRGKTLIEIQHSLEKR